MAQGRVSAVLVATTLAASLLLLCGQTHLAHAATYTVGGSGGWTFNLVGWPRGKSFRAGDTLG